MQNDLCMTWTHVLRNRERVAAYVRANAGTLLLRGYIVGSTAVGAGFSMGWLS